MKSKKEEIEELLDDLFDFDMPDFVFTFDDGTEIVHSQTPKERRRKKREAVDKLFENLGGNSDGN